MSHSDDDILSEQEFQELLPRVREDLRAQGLSEEEIAEGIAGLPDRLPRLRMMLAEFEANFGHLADDPSLPDDPRE